MRFLRFTLLLAFATACSILKPTTQHDVFRPQAQLPQEEAPHPKNSLEWWYFTGHLKDISSGESFGVEYVFFHFSPDGKQDYQMVNFALTDPQTQQFRYDYDLGKLPQPLTATLPLSLRETKGRQAWTLTGQEGRYNLEATMAAHPGQSISLSTTPAKPVLLHGGTGYEQYGALAQAGYYSYPRLTTTGSITVAGKTHRVAGELWYDRQWNCGSVNKKNVGWDWLSIQLDDPKEDLMLYAVHDKATGQHLGGGSHYGPQGENLHLAEADFQLEPLTYWTSPNTKRRYPAKWHVTVPSKGYDLVVEPLVPGQELSLRLFKVLNLHYWEGMCRVTGTRHGRPVTGHAYVEITNR
jgi:predicted secreted hydrolase